MIRNIKSKLSSFLAFILISIVLLNCERNDQGFVIYGEISGNVPNKIYIEYNNRLDSCDVENNKFQFVGQAPNYTEAKISTSGSSAFEPDWIYLENGQIELEVNIEQRKSNNVEYNWISIDTMYGTKTALVRNRFNEFIRKIEYHENRTKLLYQEIDRIIQENPKNNYSCYIIAEHAEDLSPLQLKSLIKKIDMDAVTIRNAEELLRIMSPSRILKIGSEIPDFQLRDLNKNMINFSELEGKIILVEFWASWCKPCRTKHPKLKKLYSHFDTKEFEILGISLDTDIDKWIKAISDDGLPWTNVIEDSGFNGKVASRFDIYALPKSFLVDKEGIIVEIDISMNGLENYLNNLEK